ncbi:MAG: ion transporter [Rhodospirillales bacterium]|nr:ion transporter [Rhodospirillales bacterium]
MYAHLKRATHIFLETSAPGDKAGIAFDYFMILLIIANVFAIILETVEHIFDAAPEFFFWFEIFSVAVFTIEYLLRVWAVTEDPKHGYGHPVWGRLRFMISPMAVVDLLAFLPFYLSAFLGLDLRMLRVIRLLRLLKLSRYSPALSVIGAVVVAQQRALMAALLVMLIALLFSSSILFALEREVQPDKFSSIPDAMWWAVATLTTVGYGDVTPITPLGRFVGGITMILGIGMFALPTGVIATGFADEIRKRDFVVNWKLVSGVPLFQTLDATQIAEIVSLLTPLIVPPNHAVVRVGEEADSMFFIISGRMEVELPPKPFVLEGGEFFGEMGVMAGGKRSASVVSLTECSLLELKAEDFKGLLQAHPSINESLSKVMEARANQHNLEPNGKDV